MFQVDEARIGIVGLGYVGLPLAVEFGRKFPTIGLDVNPERVAELQSGRDHTLEVEPRELASATHLRYTHDPADLRQCNVLIVTVPQQHVFSCDHIAVRSDVQQA